LELITQALSEGTHLACNNQKYQLDCFCCKCYHQKKGKRATTNLQAHHISDSVSDHSDDATSDVDDDTDSIIDRYDTFGVKFGICRYQYLQERYAQRPDGGSDVKGTTTQRPTNPSERCFVKLVLKFHEFVDLDHGYIHLSCGFGSRLHKFHAKTNPGDMCQHKRHLPTASQKVLASSWKALIGSPSMRKLVIEHSNQYVWKSTIQHVLDVDPNCLKANATSSGSSSAASQLIDWLGEKSVDRKIKLRYKVL
jgi:hypothetical protein